MGKAAKFLTARHQPDTIYWRPVDRRKVIETDHGGVVAHPDRHIELLDLETGRSWPIEIEDFAERYDLDGEAREAFCRLYPKVAAKYLSSCS